jgi:hypothetical protein
MSRGLLIHHVQLDRHHASGTGDARIAACRVIAPTDWNFHPEGAVAAALEASPAGSDRGLSAIVAVYDPCVPYRIARDPDSRRAANDATGTDPLSASPSEHADA